MSGKSMLSTHERDELVALVLAERDARWTYVRAIYRHGSTPDEAQAASDADHHAFQAVLDWLYGPVQDDAAQTSGPEVAA